jgi:hypothetical protein
MRRMRTVVRCIADVVTNIDCSLDTLKHFLPVRAVYL